MGTNLWYYRGSEVEDGDVEKVAKAFRLVQVVYVVMVAGWGGQAKERREHWGGGRNRRILNEICFDCLSFFSQLFCVEQTHLLKTSGPPTGLRL